MAFLAWFSDMKPTSSGRWNLGKAEPDLIKSPSFTGKGFKTIGTGLLCGAALGDEVDVSLDRFAFGLDD